MVETKKAEFRSLRLRTLNDLRAEIDRLVQADAQGGLRTSGNWTLGQAFGHIASWINFSYDGYPPSVRPPWFVKLYFSLQRSKIGVTPMPRGLRIPKMAGGTLGTEPLSTTEGAARLGAAVDRLEAGCPTQASPIFGVLTHEKWIAMNLRHAELHLGYMHPA